MTKEQILVDVQEAIAEKLGKTVGDVVNYIETQV